MTKLNIWIGRALWFGRSDLICKVLFGALLGLLIFTLADFFGVPYLVRHTVVPDMATRLKRRVQVGKVGVTAQPLTTPTGEKEALREILREYPGYSRIVYVPLR
jgi:hypothetical protein